MILERLLHALISSILFCILAYIYQKVNKKYPAGSICIGYVVATFLAAFSMP